MGAQFTAERQGKDRAGDGYRSATVDTAYNTVASRFDKVPCMDGTAAGTGLLSVVQVTVVTDVKSLGKPPVRFASAISRGWRPVLKPVVPQKGDWRK
jgi:hypothetical protein